MSERFETKRCIKAIINTLPFLSFSLALSAVVRMAKTVKEKGKGKEEYLYTAFIQRSVSKRSDMDHTVLPANYTMPAFPSLTLGPELIPVYMQSACG